MLNLHQFYMFIISSSNLSSFSPFSSYSEEPWDVDGAWHVDGHWFTRYLFTNEHALTLVMLFSDVLPCGGGTAVAEGSHLVAAQLLSQVSRKAYIPAAIAFRIRCIKVTFICSIS
jgi:hypothetical protein